MGEEGNGQPRLSEAAADSDEAGWAGEASAFLVAAHAGTVWLQSSAVPGAGCRTEARSKTRYRGIISGGKFMPL